MSEWVSLTEFWGEETKAEEEEGEIEPETDADGVGDEDEEVEESSNLIRGYSSFMISVEVGGVRVVGCSCEGVGGCSEASVTLKLSVVWCVVRGSLFGRVRSGE